MKEAIETTGQPEQVRLEEGINILEMPGPTGRRLPLRPSIPSQRIERRAPGTKEEEIQAVECFFDSIQEQGGVVVGIIERKHSINLDEARYLDELNIESATLVIVQK